jgi:hypothetical protein
LTQNGNRDSAQRRRHSQLTPTVRPRGLEELIEHPGLAAAVAVSQNATESRPLPHVPIQTAARDLPAAEQQANAPRPRRLALWERILIGAIASAFFVIIIS